MYDYQTHQTYSGDPGSRPGGSVFRTVAMWTALAIGVFILFGVLAWAFGLVVGLIGFLIKVAIVTAVVAFVWRRVAHRRRGGYGC